MDEEQLGQQYASQLYQELGELGRSLSSDKRLEILDLLTQADKTVAEIAQLTGMSVANTSRHLQILHRSHLVTTSRRGNYIVYHLSSPQVRQLVELLIDIGEQENSAIKAIQEDFAQQTGVHTITLTQAIQARDTSFILDVRPVDEYQAGHIRGAINIPFADLDRRMGELSHNGPIIVYCRGRFCPYPDLATKKLLDNGFRAVSLNVAYYDWPVAFQQ